MPSFNATESHLLLPRLHYISRSPIVANALAMRESERSGSHTPSSPILRSLLSESIRTLAEFFFISTWAAACNGYVYLYGFLEALDGLFGRFKIISDLHLT